MNLKVCMQIILSDLQKYKFCSLGIFQLGNCVEFQAVSCNRSTKKSRSVAVLSRQFWSHSVAQGLNTIIK